MMVGVTLLMRFTLLALLLLLAGSLSLILWPSFAAGGGGGGGSKSIDVDHAVQQVELHQVQDGPIITKQLREEEEEEEEANIIHERRVLMRVNTRDYGNYNPAPKLSKPRSKRIPN